MKFLIDLDGPLIDVRRRLYTLHRELMAQIGLASRGEEEFWQMIRRGDDADRHVGPARPAQREIYNRGFLDNGEREDLLELDELQPDVVPNLRVLKQMGTCILITMRLNKPGAQAAIDRYDLSHLFDRMRSLSQVRSERINQLRELSAGDPKTMVITSSEPVLIAARECSFFTVGISDGPATPQRLRRAGADFVVGNVSELVDNLRPLSETIRRAGWNG